MERNSSRGRHGWEGGLGEVDGAAGRRPEADGCGAGHGRERGERGELDFRDVGVSPRERDAGRGGFDDRRARFL